MVNARDRAAFLTEHCHIDSNLFPTYFKQLNGKAVTSLNNEVVTRNGEVFIVWYPQTDFGIDFFRFAKQWKNVFTAGTLTCLSISTNGPTRSLLNRIEPEID
ncbi:MAG: hypothetical protein QNK37_20310 [Acidobacteriota bacterium]|nr:hypothetical protein [Acidobacteriota bacterium]